MKKRSKCAWRMPQRSIASFVLSFFILSFGRLAKPESANLLQIRVSSSLCDLSSTLVTLRAAIHRVDRSGDMYRVSLIEQLNGCLSVDEYSPATSELKVVDGCLYLRNVSRIYRDQQYAYLVIKASN